MIKNKTVFIVGAGASEEFGLPIGRGLVDMIRKALGKSAGGNLNAFVRLGFEESCGRAPLALNSLTEKAHFVSKALSQAQSIDTFVHNHRHDPEIAMVAKLAIAACILDREHQSNLYAPAYDHEDVVALIGRVRDTWLGRLWTILVDRSEATSAEAIFQNVTFIVFNYDRCIEHYFIFALSNYYGLSIATARKVVAEHLSIIHPYGELEQLSQENPFGWPYHLRPSGHRLMEMANNIRTFTEAQSDQAIEHRIKQAIVDAERVVFLGFGFHQQNVDLLTPDLEQLQGIRKVRATALGLSESNILFAQRDIGTIVRDSSPVHVDFFRGKCCDLIDSEYLFLSR